MYNLDLLMPNHYTDTCKIEIQSGFQNERYNMEEILFFKTLNTISQSNLLELC